MKKFVLIALLALFLFGTGAMMAQELNVEQCGIRGHNTDSKKRPDLSTVLIGFNGFDETTRQIAEDAICKTDPGVRFNHTSPPCDVPVNIICVKLQKGPGESISMSGSSGGWGRNGGGLTSGSFNGTNYLTTIYFSLIGQTSTGMRKIIVFGHTGRKAAVGSGTDSVSSYGGNSGGSTTTTTTVGPYTAYQAAVREELIALLSKHIGSRFLASSPEGAGWSKDSAKLVAEAFPPEDDVIVPTPLPKPAVTQPTATAKNTAQDPAASYSDPE